MIFIIHSFFSDITLKWQQLFILSLIFLFRHNLEVTAPSLNISEEVKSLGTVSNDNNQTFSLVRTDVPDSSTLRAISVKGPAQVRCQEWFSTLGIKTKWCVRIILVEYGEVKLVETVFIEFQCTYYQMEGFIWVIKFIIRRPSLFQKKSPNSPLHRST